jgi:hypothetical protein
LKAAEKSLSTPTNPDDQNLTPPKRQLSWTDSLVPTVSISILVVALIFVAGPYILGLILTLVLTDPQSATTVPFVILASVVAVLLITVLTWQARHSETRNSFWLPPMVPLICIFILFLIANRSHFHIMTESEFKAKLQDPQFVRNLGLNLSAMQVRVIRSAISEGSFTAEELDELLNRPEREFELQIATSSHAYAQNFSCIAIHGKIETQEAMIQNPAIPDEVVRQLLVDHPPNIVQLAQHVLAQRVCDPDTLQSTYLQKSDRLVSSNRPNFLASDPELPQLLADNPCTPTDVLLKMSQSGRSNITDPALAALARRGVTPKWHLP